MRRPLAAVLALALFAHASGCVTRKVKKTLDEETRASLTVSGDAKYLAAVLEQLNDVSDVRTTSEAIETGVAIVRIVGAYRELLDALVWLVQRNLQLLANDKVTESLLAIAFSALK